MSPLAVELGHGLHKGKLLQGIAHIGGSTGMATLIVRLGDNQYVKWSNTTDSPVSYVMSREEIIEHLEGADDLSFTQADHLLEIADRTGTSDPQLTLEGLVSTNRAGIDESALSVAEILVQYRASTDTPPS